MSVPIDRSININVDHQGLDRLVNNLVSFLRGTYDEESVKSEYVSFVDGYINQVRQRVLGALNDFEGIITKGIKAEDIVTLTSDALLTPSSAKPEVYKKHLFEGKLAGMRPFMDQDPNALFENIRRYTPIDEFVDCKEREFYNNIAKKILGERTISKGGQQHTWANDARYKALAEESTAVRTFDQLEAYCTRVNTAKQDGLSSQSGVQAPRYTLQDKHDRFDRELFIREIVTGFLTNSLRREASTGWFDYTESIDDKTHFKSRDNLSISLRIILSHWTAFIRAEQNGFGTRSDQPVTYKVPS